MAHGMGSYSPLVYLVGSLTQHFEDLLDWSFPVVAISSCALWPDTISGGKRLALQRLSVGSWGSECFYQNASLDNTRRLFLEISWEGDRVGYGARSLVLSCIHWTPAESNFKYAWVLKQGVEKVFPSK